jgi:hypothetical protein
VVTFENFSKTSVAQTAPRSNVPQFLKKAVALTAHSRKKFFSNSHTAGKNLKIPAQQAEIL